MCALFKLGGTWLLSFALWGFVVEEEYGFDLVLRYRVRWPFFDYDGNSCQGGDCCFCDLNLVSGLCPTQRPTMRLF